MFNCFYKFSHDMLCFVMTKCHDPFYALLVLLWPELIKRMLTLCDTIYLQSVAHVYSGLMQAAGASEKVFQFINREPVIPNRNGLKPASLRGHLEFNNVTFAYPSRPETKVLKVSVIHNRKVALSTNKLW